MTACPGFGGPCDREYDRDAAAHGLCKRCYRRWYRAHQHEGYLWAGQVAKVLGVSVRTVERYWDRGLLSGRWTETGRRLISIPSVRGYLQEHDPTPEQCVLLQELTDLGRRPVDAVELPS